MRIDDAPATAVADEPSQPNDAAPTSRAGRIFATISVAVLAVLGVVAVTFGDWLRVQDVDPEYTRDIVERTIKYGGTYYENGIHNKGPLEPFVYQVASWFTSWDSYWYAISFFVALITLVLAYCTARVTRYAGGSNLLGIAAGAVVFVHFSLSGSDYAGVLYSRNITTCLLALTFTLTFATKPWRSHRGQVVAAIATGALVGLAVQTLTATVLTGGALLVLALVALAVRADTGPKLRPLAFTMVASAAVTFLSAPVYYALRGRFDEFWSGWFTYAGYMSSGTGRGLGAQFSLGWDQLGEYYRHRPLAALLIGAFVVVTAIDWRRLDQLGRLFRVGLLAWLAAAWVEMILSQRYSSHYFSITSVPTAFIVAALAGITYENLTVITGRVRTQIVWPIVAAAIAVYAFGPHYLTDGLREARDFDGFSEHAAEIEQTQSGGTRSVRAVLDLVSDERDPLLAWTNNPWPYLDLHRVSATRFIWNSFLLGQIYLGRTSPDYVLPDSRRWFADDLRESHPVAFIEDGATVDSTTPFGKYTNETFDLVYGDGRNPVYLRHDVARDLLEGETDGPWRPRRGNKETAWTTSAGSARFRPSVGDQTPDPLPIAGDSCFRLTGTMQSNAGAPRVAFRFVDNAGQHERAGLVYEDGYAASVSDFVQFAQMPVDDSNGQPVPFALIVGRRSAALVVDSEVKAAVRLPRAVSVSAESDGGALTLSDLRVGSAPAGSGCN